MKAHIRIERLVSFGNYENLKLGIEVESDGELTGAKVRNLADQMEAWVDLARKRSKLWSRIADMELIIAQKQSLLESSTPESRKLYRAELQEAKAEAKRITLKLKENGVEW